MFKNALKSAGDNRCWGGNIRMRIIFSKPHSDGQNTLRSQCVATTFVEFPCVVAVRQCCHRVRSFNDDEIIRLGGSSPNKRSPVFRDESNSRIFEPTPILYTKHRDNDLDFRWVD